MSTVCSFYFTLSCQAAVCFYLRICVCIRSPRVNPSGHMQTAVVSLQLAAHEAKGQLAQQFIHVVSLFRGFVRSRRRSLSTYERISKALSLREPLTVFESAFPKLAPPALSPVKMLPADSTFNRSLSQANKIQLSSSHSAPTCRIKSNIYRKEKLQDI